MMIHDRNNISPCDCRGKPRADIVKLEFSGSDNGAALVRWDRVACYFRTRRQGLRIIDKRRIKRRRIIASSAS